MLQARKVANLEEVVGEGSREEIPEEEDIRGPSGEAEKQSSGKASLQWSNSLATTR